MVQIRAQIKIVGLVGSCSCIRARIGSAYSVQLHASLADGKQIPSMGNSHLNIVIECRHVQRVIVRFKITKPGIYELLRNYRKIAKI